MGLATDQQQPSGESTVERLMLCSLNMRPDPLCDPGFRVTCVDVEGALNLAEEFMSSSAISRRSSGLASEADWCLPIPEIAARVRRELHLLKATHSNQSKGTDSELDRRENANAAYVHLAYLKGLRRQLEAHALEQGLAKLPTSECERVHSLWQTIDRAVTNFFTIQIQRFETWHQTFASLPSQSRFQLSAKSSRIAAKMIEGELLGSLIDLQCTQHEGELLKYAVLKAVSQPPTTSERAELLAPTSSIREMLKHVETSSSAVDRHLRVGWETLASYDCSATRQASGVTTIDTAGLSPEQRTTLAGQIVALITESLKGGGRFNAAENTVENFTAALALPKTRFHGIFDNSGTLKGAAVAHLGEFPEKYRRLAKQYAGSLRPGLIRFIAISTELQGSAAYDNLNHRMILDASATVDFLVGRWRVGRDANLKGGRHVKAKHLPLGDVERDDAGKIFQHLIVPINHHLRKAINLITPKGYHAPEHPGMCKRIIGSSTSDEESYQTPLFPRLITEVVDRRLAACVREDPSDLEELYREHPEGLHPKHLRLRFKIA